MSAGTVALFCEALSVVNAAEIRAIRDRIRAEGGDLEVYALAWPDYPAPLANRPRENRDRWQTWRQAAGVDLWAWLNAQPDQAADVAAMHTLDADLAPSGWLLDIEGKWTATAKLTTLANGCAVLGRPRRASLAGVSAAITSYDYRSLDLAGLAIDWQSYLDSGEGPAPSDAVRELYRSSIVVGGWEYRHRLGSVYGWGKVTGFEHAQGLFDSYKRPGGQDAIFATAPREFGRTVVDGRLFRGKKEIGRLMGRAVYSQIRVTLDVTRGYANARSLADWTALAASAKIPHARKRPASIYCGSERPPADVIVAIARGAG